MKVKTVKPDECSALRLAWIIWRTRITGRAAGLAREGHQDAARELSAAVDLAIEMMGDMIKSDTEGHL